MPLPLPCYIATSSNDSPKDCVGVILVKVADALDNVALADSASLTLDWCRRYLTIVAHNLVSEMKVDALCSKMKSRDEQASSCSSSPAASSAIAGISAAWSPAS